jgi:hypothetical protein
MSKSAEGVVEKAVTFTGVVQRVIIAPPKIKKKIFSVTQWEKRKSEFKGFI